MTKNETRRPLVCLLASAETSPSVLYGLYDVLSTAGAIYGELTNGKTGDEVLDVRIVAATAEPFRCFGGVMVEPHDGLNALDEADFIIVCDMYTPIDAPPRGVYDREIEWIKRMYAKGSMLGSVCSGSLVLAEAGLLDGEETSGHWAYRELFREHYPKVKLRLGEILSFAGEADRIVTAGGVTSWQELALYVIARLCGSEHAIQAAKIHILSGHSEGQLPYAVITHRVQHTDAVIGDCQAWIVENYSCTNDGAVWSEAAHLGAPVQSSDRLPADGLCASHPHRGGQAAARGQLRQRRGDRSFGRLRGSDLLPPPVQAPGRHDPGGLPQEVHQDRRGRLPHRGVSRLRAATRTPSARRNRARSPARPHASSPPQTSS